MTAGTERLFVYGTLLDRAVRRTLTGRDIPGVPDQLEGYMRGEAVLDGQTYPDLRERPGRAVDGERIEVSSSELAALDAYEGPDYRRIRVALASGQTAWVYRTRL